MQRGTVLDEAKVVINGERQDTYGNPENSFNTVAGLWTTFLEARFPNNGVILIPKDIALLMTLFKIARETHQGKRDNLIDAAGYIGIAGDMTEEKKQIEAPSYKSQMQEYVTANR